MADQMSLADELLPHPQTAQPTNEFAIPIGESSAEPHTPRAANVRPLPSAPPPLGVLISQAVEADPAFLSLLADVVDDMERVRIANENRLRHLTRSEPDADGETRGLGLDLRNPHVMRIAAIVEQISAAEHSAVLALQNLMRKHPLGAWAKAQRGVGEKQLARLLAVIGDPYMRPELVREDGTVEAARPRLVSELWAYCGLHVLPARQKSHDGQGQNAGGDQTSHPGHSGHDTQVPAAGVAPKRQRGQRANWSTLAKTRTYLIAEACVKTLRKPCAVDKGLGYALHTDDCGCSPFRRVYDETKAHYADAVHEVECVRCGPSGRPALPGSPLSNGHKHARAMRKTSKEILKELWRESRRLHQDAAGGVDAGA